MSGRTSPVGLTVRGPSALADVETPSIVHSVARRLWRFFIVMVLALAFVPWQQTSRGQGRLIAFAPTEREQFVEAPVPGRVAEWHVIEGERVRAGQPLATLVDNAPEILDRLREERTSALAEIDAAEKGIAALESQLESLVVARGLFLEAADAQIRGAHQKVKAAENQLEAARAEERIARLNLQRRETLEAKGLTSRRDLEVAQFDAAKTRTAALQARARLEESKAELLSKQAERAHKASDTDAKISKERSTLEKTRAELAKALASRAKVDVRLQRQKAQDVTAPRDGIILRILKNQGGEQVKSGDALAVLVPDSNERAVELWVSGNDAPLITPGRHVRLQFEGWPAVQFSGWPSVAVGTFGGEVAFVDYAANVKGHFRVLIKQAPNDDPWPDQAHLRQGARANGWVLLDRVTLGFEVWRQLNGFPPVAPEDAAWMGGRSEDSGGKK